MQHYALDGAYPLNTTAQVKIACRFFRDHIKSFTPAERVKIASAIKQRGARLRVAEADQGWVHNYARYMDKEASYSPSFERGICARKTLLQTKGIEKVAGVGGVETDACALLDKLASHKDSMTPHQMATCLEDFDKLAGLQDRYDVDIDDPVMTVCGSRSNPEYDGVKIAGDATQYDIARLLCNPEKLEKLASVFDQGMVELFKKAPARTIANMSSADKTVFAELCK